MKRIGILVLIYLVGVVSGAVYHSMTTGAADRARIATLDGQLRERNEKLDKCTTALIEGLPRRLLDRVQFGSRLAESPHTAVGPLPRRPIILCERAC